MLKTLMRLCPQIQWGSSNCKSWSKTTSWKAFPSRAQTAQSCGIYFIGIYFSKTEGHDIVLSQSNLALSQTGTLTPMQILFKQQMYFQKQQAEQLSLFQQQQAEQQAEFQKRCLDFMKGVWFWYYLIFLIICCTKWKTGVERYISDKNESKTGQRTGILSVLGTLISEISLENGIKTVEHFLKRFEVSSAKSQKQTIF